MVNFQEHLSRINLRITSGLAVIEEDWVTLRTMSNNLGTTFNEEVEFSWEIKDESTKKDEEVIDSVSNGLDHEEHSTHPFNMDRTTEVILKEGGTEEEDLEVNNRSCRCSIRLDI